MYKDNISSFKIVVLLYIDGAQSGVITIAYSFGKPVIATDIGSIPDVVENGKRGYLVPPKDSKALADAIIKLLKDDKLRKQMGKNILKEAEDLSWDNIAKMHIEVYEEAIHRRKTK